jgi:hypothetical protein
MFKIAVLGWVLVSATAWADTKGQKLPVPEVKLLDAGSGARKQLRVKPTVGTKQTMVMGLKMAMSIDSPMVKLPKTQLPIMKMTMDAKVTAIDPSGDVHYDYAFTKVDVDGAGANPAVVDAVKKSSASLVGITGHVIVNTRNFTTFADINIPPDVEPTVRQMLDSVTQSFSQLSAPFPEEAVGVGAKWRVKMMLSLNGITLKQDANYTLTKLDGSQLAATITLDQKADPQPFSGPSVPAGLKMRVVSWQGNGGGDLVYDMSKFLATRATMTASSAAKMSIEMGSDHQDMAMTTDVTVDVR